VKIKCPKCKYIFEIEKGYGEEAEDFVLCQSCGHEIIISNIKEYDEKDDIEYININKWDNNKIITIYTKSKKIFFSGIISIAIGLFGLIQSIINSWISNIFIYLLFCIGGSYFCAMYFFGKIEFSIGMDSNVFTGIGKIGFKKKIDWNDITEIYKDKSMFKRGRKYYIVLKGKKKYRINTTWINEDERECLLNTLKNLRFRKINEC
jgi:hypothetical protein